MGDETPLRAAHAAAAHVPCVCPCVCALDRCASALVFFLAPSVLSRRWRRWMPQPSRLPPALFDQQAYKRHQQDGTPFHHPLLLAGFELPPSAAAASAAAAPCFSESTARVELGVHSGISSLDLTKPVQFGLFAVLPPGASPTDSPMPVAFCKGQRVCAYGGVLLSDNMRLSNAPRSHARRVLDVPFVLDGLPLACMLRRPIPRTASRLTELVAAGVRELLPSAPTFSAAELAVFAASPLGFMANTAAPAQCNVAIEYVQGKGRLGRAPVLVATRDIAGGEEILSPYQNVEASELRKQWLPRTPPQACAVDTCIRMCVLSAPVAAARLRRIDLLRGLPSNALQRQRANLDAFIEEHAEEFAQQRYAAWTVPSPSPRRSQLRVDVRASELLPGLQGVFPHRHASSSSSPSAGRGKAAAQTIVDYPGVLMSEQLHSRFAKQYHCPTALDVTVPSLTYCTATKQRKLPPKKGKSAPRVTKMVLVGDPTQPGPIINDGLRSNLTGTNTYTCTHASGVLRARASASWHGQCTRLLMLRSCDACCARVQ